MTLGQSIFERVARPAVMAIALAFALSTIWVTLRAHWAGGDMGAYWEAAIRLREGQPLYVPHADVNAVNVYRYAPWFAWAWIPLTSLPRGSWKLGGAWS